MALKIRLTRGGAKKRPYYRIIVADSRFPRDGRFIDRIGAYDPMKPKDAADRVVLDVEKAKEWLAKGAQPTDSRRPLPRPGRRDHARSPQQPAEGQARQEGRGARRRAGREGCRRRCACRR